MYNKSSVLFITLYLISVSYIGYILEWRLSVRQSTFIVFIWMTVIRKWRLSMTDVKILTYFTYFFSRNFFKLQVYSVLIAFFLFWCVSVYTKNFYFSVLHCFFKLPAHPVFESLLPLQGLLGFSFTCLGLICRRFFIFVDIFCCVSTRTVWCRFRFRALQIQRLLENLLLFQNSTFR